MGLFGFLFNLHKNNQKKVAKKEKENEIEKTFFEKETQYKFLDNVNHGLQSKLTDDEIIKLSNECKKELGHELPEDYKSFLRVTNGFYGNGVRVLGIFNEDIIKNNPTATSRTFDILKWHSIGWEWSEQYIILGIDSTSYIGYDVVNEKFVRMDRGTLDVFAESNFFTLLFEQMLKDNNILDD